MKLFYSSTSPYSRKVRLVILEKGLSEQIKTILVDPFGASEALNAANPLGKVPTLLLDNGEALFDSPVICRYLDSLSEDFPLIPRAGWRQWATLRWEALADGMTDAAYNSVMERRRPASAQSSTWLAHWAAEIQRSLQEMENKMEELAGDITLTHLAAGAAIGYLDLRMPDVLYEAACPQVAAYPHLLTWYEAFKTRPSMLTTHPLS
jgi:glutathione S-transferase